MNRTRIMGLGLAAGLGLAFFALQAQGVPTLIFIDNFETNQARLYNSSPYPGAGGGQIGGPDFWSSFSNSSVRSNFVDNGSLTIMVQNPTNVSATARIDSARYEQFNFVNLPAGDGHLLSLRGFEMDWDDGYGRIQIGFHDRSGSYHSSTNGAVIRFHGSGAVGISYKQDRDGFSSDLVLIAAPAGSERPTGADFFVSATGGYLTVYYSQFAPSQTIGWATNFTGSWPDLLLTMELSPRVTGEWARASLGEIQVTYIPEPGTVSLALGAMGAALLVRRVRRRRRV